MTLAASLSVALRTARLIDETQKRVSELATINSVGEALDHRARAYAPPHHRRQETPRGIRGGHCLHCAP